MGTRFRAYQLCAAGSSFSYCHDGQFILIEARVTETSAATLLREVRQYGGGRVSLLHITSWDNDHCDPAQLLDILKTFKPDGVEAPGYPIPDTDSARESVRLLREYERVGGTVLAWTPQVVGSLPTALPTNASQDVLLWPYGLSEGCNDNSTAKLFRRGHFSVLSLGDLESPEIATRIMGMPTTREADVMILAHHGADNGFTTREFLEAIKPRVAISTSDYGNQFEHPRQEIRDLLFEFNIPLYTTKTGDVLIQSVDGDPRFFRVVNYKADTEEVSSTRVFGAKFNLKPGTYAT
jgi:competence protein ComEC